MSQFTFFPTTIWEDSKRHFDEITKSKVITEILAVPLLKEFELDGKFLHDYDYRATKSSFRWKEVDWATKGIPHRDRKYKIDPNDPSKSKPAVDRLPVGFIKGLMLTFARSYLRLLDGDPIAAAIGAPVNPGIAGGVDNDVLSIYRDHLAKAGLSNDTAIERFRNVWSLMIGKGKHESGGCWCNGQDESRPQFQTADAAESGLFQTSYNVWNVKKSHEGDKTGEILKGQIDQLMEAYLSKPSEGFLGFFHEGVSACEWGTLKHSGQVRRFFGGGSGRKFQELSRVCPAFAAESTALALRKHAWAHYAAVQSLKIQVFAESDRMFQRVAALVDSASDKERNLLRLTPR